MHIGSYSGTKHPVAYFRLYFVADNTTGNKNVSSAVLAQIDTEHGTNIHIMRESELAKHRLIATDPISATTYKVVNPEEMVCYVAEVQLPQLKHTTQKNQASIVALSGDMSILRAMSSQVAATEKCLCYCCCCSIYHGRCI